MNTNSFKKQFKLLPAHFLCSHVPDLCTHVHDLCTQIESCLRAGVPVCLLFLCEHVHANTVMILVFCVHRHVHTFCVRMFVICVRMFMICVLRLNLVLGLESLCAYSFSANTYTRTLL